MENFGQEWDYGSTRSRTPYRAGGPGNQRLNSSQDRIEVGEHHTER